MSDIRSAGPCLIVLLVWAAPAWCQFDVPKEVPARDAATEAPAPEPPADSPQTETKRAPKPRDAEPEPEPEADQPPVDPEVVRLHLTDGSIVTGKFSVPEITVDTEFGALQVPITRIRRFVPGLESHPGLYGRIRELIEQLGGSDYKARETAEQELFKLGAPIRGELAQYRDDSNAERARRVKAILSKLEELDGDDFDSAAGREEWIREDTVETIEFTIVGRISPERFTVNNRFGTLTIGLEDIKSVERGEESQDIRKSLSVPASYIVQKNFKSTGVLVEKGDRILVEADGRIVRSGSSSYFSDPGGSSRLQTYTSNPTIYGGTLVARIGKGGKVQKVGKNATLTADQPGVLYFSIAMSSNYARYPFIGQYNVKLKVERGDQ